MQIVRANEQPFVAASHENPRQPGVLKRVLATRGDLLDGRVQMINWARLPQGSSFRSHYHEDMQEVFIILDGEVEMTVNGAVDSLGPGDAILIAPREVHQMKNASGHDVHYLVVGIALGLNGKTVVVDDTLSGPT